MVFSISLSWLSKKQICSKWWKNGSVVVDVAIDQGGCFETSKATTHDEPCFEVDGVIHYCVTNMPGAVAKTSTLALTNATLPYAIEIANKGWKKAMQKNKEINVGPTSSKVRWLIRLPPTRLRPVLVINHYWGIGIMGLADLDNFVFRYKLWNCY